MKKNLSIDDLIGDYNKGWLVARNPIRALNHLSRLKEYTEIANRLFLSFECEDKVLVEQNFSILKNINNGKLILKKLSCVSLPIWQLKINLLALRK